MQNKSDDAEMRDDEEENKHGINFNVDAGNVTSIGMVGNDSDANGDITHGNNHLEADRLGTVENDSDNEQVLADSTTNLSSGMSESTATITPLIIGARLPISETQQQQQQPDRAATSTVTSQLSEIDEWLREVRERDTMGPLESLGSLGSLGPLSTISGVVSATAGTTSVTGNVVSETGGQDAEIPVQA